MRRGSRRGFTLIEAMVATVLLGVGVAAVMGGFGSMTRTQTNLQERERMQRLAVQKYDELVATGEYSASSLTGDFADWGDDRYSWAGEVTPTGVENLETLRVTVTRRAGGEASAVIEGAIFVPPVTTEGGAP